MIKKFGNRLLYAFVTIFGMMEAEKQKGVVSTMMMNGKLLHSIDELKRNFSIDDLVACYYSGELLFFLQKLGEYDKLARLQRITPNGNLTAQLYDLFGLSTSMTEQEIRNRYS